MWREERPVESEGGPGGCLLQAENRWGGGRLELMVQCFPGFLTWRLSW